MERAVGNILKIIVLLVAVDTLYLYRALIHVRNTGEFHYLLSTFHHLLFLVVVSFAGVSYIKNFGAGVLFQLVFCAVFLFIFNITFEINDYLIRRFNREKYSLDGMTEQGKALMQSVFDDMEENNKRSMATRVSQMISNFTSNIGQDFEVVWMTLTKNQKMKDAFSEIHDILGNKKIFSEMSMFELFMMARNRILINIVVILFVALMWMTVV